LGHFHKAHELGAPYGVCAEALIVQPDPFFGSQAPRIAKAIGLTISGELLLRVDKIS
jgi:hypothetical protein